MKKTTKLKSMVLLVMMMAVMLVPTSAFAQNDDFFRTEDNFGGNRFTADWAIVNNGIGQSEAPLGSGLLILTAVGAGYAVARRKSYTAYKTHKSYNSGATLVLALALLLGMTNCRKNVDTISSVPSDGVYITLNVDGGEKVVVDPTGHTSPNYATVTWEDGDILYVGNNGAYCGYLTYDGEKFGGDITPTSGDDGDYLHFYFMGNKGTTSEPTSVYITDQTSKYPVISYGRSTSLYNSGTTTYSAKLLNKCAIGKFTISGVDTDKAITVTGMNNTVAVDFSKNGTGDVVNPYTYSKTGSGEIRLHAESNTVRWAILLPQDEVTTATAYASGYTSTNAFTVPAVSANGYYDSGVSIAMVAKPSYIDAPFTVASGTTVKFSKGNLQYRASTDEFRFADNQWDYVGNATNGTVYENSTKCNNASISSTYTGWIDLFGWGTSGYNSKYPYMTSTTSNKYGNGTNNISGTNYDWGVYNKQSNRNKITDGGDHAWRTLTKDEWVYLFNTRSTTSGVRYAKATVNGVKGVILLPDNWSTSYYTLTSTNTSNAAYTSNVITLSDWNTSLEANGAVFLPVTGYRNNTTVYNAGSDGLYWSGSYSGSNQAYRVLFNSDNLYPQDSYYRYRGYSVRLVF